jgi:proteasome lid subunit RPN8/RPN11
MIRGERVQLLEGPKQEERIKPLHFVFSAELLRACAQRVDFTRRWREELVYLVGEARGDLRVAQKIVEVETQGSLLSVRDLPQSLHTLLDVTRDGSVLCGLAHSHPEWYPIPSLIDWNTQARLEVHYDLVGLVFGLGGLVRFYRIRPFEVEVQGEGVEEVCPYVYRLARPWDR